MNEGVIYKITCLANNLTYIGATINFKKRWVIHKRYFNLKKHPNHGMQEDWNRFGIKNFKIEIIETNNKEVLFEREKYWIEKLNPDYNIITKANAGKIRTEYHKQQIRKANSNRTEEQRERMAEKCARTYNFITPQNEKITITNLKKFCRENQLDLSAMLKVTKGKIKTYKGWKKPAI